MNNKINWIGASIGIVGAVIASSIYLIKKHKDNKDLSDSKDSQTLFLYTTPSEARAELMKSELSENDQAEAQ